MFEFISGSKLSRRQQIDFILLWAKLKRTKISDRSILEALNQDYINVYGPDCIQSQFCISAQHSLRAWADGRGGFDQAMGGWFDDDIIVIVSAVIASDDSQHAIQKLFTQLTQWDVIKQKIIMSVFFNTLFLLFVASVFIGLTFGSVIVKENMDIANHQIEGIGLFFIECNAFFTSYYLLILAFIILLVTSWAWTMFFYVGEHRNTLDNHMPFFGFYRANEASRFFLILSLLVTSGQRSLRDALDSLIESNLCSLYIQSHIQEMLYRLEHQGLDVNQSGNRSATFDKIDTGLLPPMLRMQLLAMQRQKSVAHQSEVLTIIADNLVEDGGEYLVKKVTVLGKVITYSSLFFVMICIVLFLDYIYSIMSLAKDGF
ncbi:hypothetical protein KFE26_20405 [Shewanella sp. M16]|uniref:hypothetical protein n=1 Tax=Shewanella TaxID=22 RepID=UPI001BAF6AC4|nr:hypothetical protein [Shewanella sp. M16]MBS0044634.1 hypothetical protein [Shewanella sp. M16]